MNTTLIKSIKLATLALWSTASFAGEFYVLDINEHMSRRNGKDTIKLKQQLKRQHGIRVRGADLLSVLVVAKSKRGRGEAQLRVGRQFSPSQLISGERQEFYSSSEQTYKRTLFTNPGSHSSGAWQLKMHGNFKVKQVVVEIDKNPTREVTLDIDMHTRTGRGGEDTVRLKAELKRQTSLIPQDYELESVMVFGKSRKGHGTASLRIGRQLSRPETLHGNPGMFRRPGARTFSAVKLENPKHNSNGVWQLKLNGNIKIKQVILSLKKK